MYYLALYFKINDDWIVTMCSRKSFRTGKVKIKVYNDKGKKKTIGKKSITDCVWISNFKSLSNKNKFMGWDERDKLFKKYPVLKKKIFA